MVIVAITGGRWKVLMESHNGVGAYNVHILTIRYRNKYVCL